MKSWLLLFFAVTILACGVTFGAPEARAQGTLNLGWGFFCPTNASSMADQTDPCDGTGVSPYHLIGSVTTALAQSQVFSGEMELNLQEAAAVLSDYWHLEDENQPGQTNPAGCRGGNSGTTNIGSLVVKSDQSSLPNQSPCNRTMWGTNAAGVNWLPGRGGANRARLNIIVGRTSGFNALAGTQYIMFDAKIDNNHQINDINNPPSYVCSGCQNAVCIVFDLAVLRQPQGTPNGDVTITDPGPRRNATWQGGTGVDCQALPVQRKTWGQVKSLYR